MYSQKSASENQNSIVSNELSDHQTLEDPKYYASPVFEKMLLENSPNTMLPIFITKEEMDREMERRLIQRSIQAYEKQYGVNSDFFHKPKKLAWSVAKRAKGGNDDESRSSQKKIPRRRLAPTSRNHAVEKPLPKSKLDDIDPSRKEKIFPHFRLTTIEYDKKNRFFPEIEDSTNSNNDDQRSRRSKSKENRGHKKGLRHSKSDAEVQTDSTGGSLLSLVISDGSSDVILDNQSRPEVNRESLKQSKQNSEDSEDIEKGKQGSEGSSGGKPSKCKVKTVKCCIYSSPSDKHSIKHEKEIQWKSTKSDSDTDACSVNDDKDCSIKRTESEEDIEKQIRPLLDKYGASYLTRKVLIIRCKLEEDECRRNLRKENSKNEDSGSKVTMECKGILKKGKEDLQPIHISSSMKCPHCNKSNIISLECTPAPESESKSSQKQDRPKQKAKDLSTNRTNQVKVDRIGKQIPIPVPNGRRRMTEESQRCFIPTQYGV